MQKWKMTAENVRLLTIVLVILVTSLFAKSQPQDECTSYVVIDDPSRNESNNQTSSNPLCDTYIINEDSWYRFVSGRISTTCPEQFYCGTVFPMWMNDSLPAGNDIENKTACIHDGGGCCGTTLQISVRKCGNPDNIYYVYKLQKPTTCDAAYCVHYPCPPNHIYNGQLKMCIDSFPNVTDVQLSKPGGVVWKEAKNNEFYPFEFHFNCSFEYQSVINQDDGARFVVVFKSTDVNGHVTQIHSESVTYPQTFVRLYGDQLKGYLGTTLFCVLGYFWEGNVHVKQEKRSETSYYVGIKPQESVIALLDTEEYNLHLTSTIPLTCNPGYFNGPSKFGDLCQSLVINIVSKSPYDVTFIVDGSRSSSYQCVARIASQTWNETTHTCVSTTPIVVTSRITAGQSQLRSVLQFHAYDRQYIPVYVDYVAPPIEFQVKSDNLHYCEMWGDPHITTFMKTKYEDYMTGDFFAVKGLETLERHFEVIVRKWMKPNNSNKARICGIVVREGNNLIGFDRCDDVTRNAGLRVIRYTTHEFSPGIEILSDAAQSKFVLLMPSGAYVVVQSLEYYLVVQIYVPPGDRDKLTGLCGSYSGSKNNDLYPSGSQTPIIINSHTDHPADFIESMRVGPNDTNYFSQPPLPVDDTHQPTQCTCTTVTGNTANVTCYNPGSQVFSNYQQYKYNLVTLRLMSPTNRNLPTTSGFSYTDNEEPNYVFNPGQFDPNRTASWPTPGGITEQQAADTCMTSLRNSSMFTTCVDVVSQTTFDNMNSDCKNDIQDADDYGPAEAMANILETSCMGEISTSVVTTENGTNNATEVLRELQSISCPNNCNGNGTCSNGTCTCNSGVTGPDCSVIEDLAPVIHEVQDGGLFDKRRRPCESSRFRVSNMAGDGFQCQTIHIKIDGNRTETQPNSTTASGSALRRGEVMCPLPTTPVELPSQAGSSGMSPAPVHGLILSVTNDGRLFSNNVTIIVYDSKCMTCSLNHLCVKKINTCLIGGYCYGDKETAISNWCNQCVANQNTSQWTINIANEPPVINTPTDTFTKKPDEDKTIQIDAVDPQNGSVVFSLIHPPPSGISITTNGLLHWSSSVKQSYSITVQSTDECGASATVEFHLVVEPHVVVPPSTTPTPSGSGESSNVDGIIAGSVTGAVVLVAAIAVVSVVLYTRSNRKRSTARKDTEDIRLKHKPAAPFNSDGNIVTSNIQAKKTLMQQDADNHTNVNQKNMKTPGDVSMYTSTIGVDTHSDVCNTAADNHAYQHLTIDIHNQ